MIDNNDNDSPLQFPCDYMIKIMGKNNDVFEDTTLIILHRYFPHFANGGLKKKISKGGNYLSLTVTVYATSRAQIDALYQELKDNPEVIMAL